MVLETDWLKRELCESLAKTAADYFIRKKVYKGKLFAEVVENIFSGINAVLEKRVPELRVAIKPANLDPRFHYLLLDVDAMISAINLLTKQQQNEKIMDPNFFARFLKDIQAARQKRERPVEKPAQAVAEKDWLSVQAALVEEAKKFFAGYRNDIAKKKFLTVINFKEHLHARLISNVVGRKDDVSFRELLVQLLDRCLGIVFEEVEVKNVAQSLLEDPQRIDRYEKNLLVAIPQFFHR